MVKVVLVIAALLVAYALFIEPPGEAAKFNNPPHDPEKAAQIDNFVCDAGFLEGATDGLLLDEQTAQSIREIAAFAKRLRRPGVSDDTAAWNNLSTFKRCAKQGRDAPVNEAEIVRRMNRLVDGIDQLTGRTPS